MPKVDDGPGGNLKKANSEEVPPLSRRGGKRILIKLLL